MNVERPDFTRAIVLLGRGLVRNLGTCLSLSAPVGLLGGAAFGVLGAVAEGGAASPSLLDVPRLLVTTMAVMAGVGSVVLVFVIVYPLAVAGLATVGSRTVSEQRCRPSDALAVVAYRGPSAIGAHLLSVTVVLAPPLAIGLTAALAARAGLAPLVGLLGLLLVASLVWPASVYLVRLSLAVPVVANEGAGAVDALRRSREHVAGGFWWVAAYLVLTTILAAIAAAIASAPFPIEGSPVAVAAGQAVGMTISTTVSGVAVGVAYGARAASPAPAVASAAPASDAV